MFMCGSVAPVGSSSLFVMATAVDKSDQSRRAVFIGVLCSLSNQSLFFLLE
jgi:arginine exporter protein ArgO